MDSDPTSPERGQEAGGESNGEGTEHDVATLRREAREYREALAHLSALQLERTGADLSAAFRGTTGGLLAFPDETVGDLRDALDRAELVVDEIAAAHPDVDDGPPRATSVGDVLDDTRAEARADEDSQGSAT